MKGGGEELIIREVRGGEDIDTVRALFLSYREYLGVDLGFQDFDTELKDLPGAYTPPGGCLLLASIASGPAGCVALKPSRPGVCEMKRLFVSPDFRGHGIGRALAETIIEKAAGLGYRSMVLDTLDTLHSAIALYGSLGFSRTAPYYHNPLPGVLFWCLELTSENENSNP